jgi:hypothetical protein
MHLPELRRGVHSIAPNDAASRQNVVLSYMKTTNATARDAALSFSTTMNRWLKSLVLTLAPAAMLLDGEAATFSESFSTPPAANGWRTFGKTNLFHWDSTNQTLRVTWDSSQTNSYLHRPLGTILTRADDFRASFDLTLDDYASGVTPGKPYAFPLVLGFFNLTDATHTNFSRGTGINATYGPKNLVEFNFFPEFDIFQPTIAQVIVATNNSQWLYNHDNLLPLTTNQTFRVTMNYTAANRTLTTTVTNNGVPYGAAQTIVVPTNMDFRCGTFSISSYSDVRDNASLLAHGTVDNLTLVTPPPPVQNLAGGFSNVIWRTQFTSQTNWLYTLERTTNFLAWTGVSATTPGNGALLTLPDSAPPTARAAYRVRADRP